MEEFQLQAKDPEGNDFIELNKLLKVLNWVENGGMANTFIVEGMVKLNGKTDTRKRAKVRRGDQVELDGQIVKVI
jgi:ribosome-associated protein